jgi:hypothetical protein
MRVIDQAEACATPAGSDGGIGDRLVIDAVDRELVDVATFSI